MLILQLEDKMLLCHEIFCFHLLMHSSVQPSQMLFNENVDQAKCNTPFYTLEKSRVNATFFIAKKQLGYE